MEISGTLWSQPLHPRWKNSRCPTKRRPVRPRNQFARFEKDKTFLSLRRMKLIFLDQSGCRLLITPICVILNKIIKRLRLHQLTCMLGETKATCYNFHPDFVVVPLKYVLKWFWCTTLFSSLPFKIPGFQFLRCQEYRVSPLKKLLVIKHKLKTKAIP
jgi:hypothetical protein